MAVCKPACATNIPATDWANGCDIIFRPGGICRLTFLICDDSMVLPHSPIAGQTNQWTNKLNVLWALCNGYLKITGTIMGQKPRGSFTKKRLRSCGPETTISGTKTIAFKDYNSDPDNLLEFDFWQSIMDNQRFLLLGWVTSDEYWYQYTGEWDLENDDVIEETKDDNTFFDGVITMSTKAIIKPIKCPGILETLDSFATAECYS